MNNAEFSILGWKNGYGHGYFQLDWNAIKQKVNIPIGALRINKNNYTEKK